MIIDKHLTIDINHFDNAYRKTACKFITFASNNRMRNFDVRQETIRSSSWSMRNTIRNKEKNKEKCWRKWQEKENEKRWQ